MPQSTEQDDARVAQQRQQVGAALLLGLVVFVVVLWRAAAHGMFPQDWWRLW